MDNRCGRRKFKIDSLTIKPHFIEAKRLKIGATNGNIDGITVKIYDRKRVMCDCLRHVDRIDGEVYSMAVQRYVRDEKKDAARLMEYAKILGVEKKQGRTIGIWL